jgi:Uma2 family endonuclease
MPTILAETEAQPVPLDPPRKLWTRAECEALEAAGLLDGQHLELIEGDLINKMGKKWPHISAVTLLKAWLVGVFGIPFVIQEAPIDVAPEDNPTNEPEPDIIVLKRELASFVSAGQPRPEDLHLVVEVAHTTLRFDLTTKAALYARAGIVDYWVLDVAGKRMIVHRDPQRGLYSSVLAFGQQEIVAPLAAPEAELRVGDVFART